MKNCILLLGATLLLFSSCRESKVEAALRLAGENRAELERVLEHFEAGGDKEKAAAARFIVGNMPGHGFPIFDPSVFVKLPGASCDEYMCMGILILRSKGIPVGMDYTPQFSDRQYGHYWNVFPNIRGRNTIFTLYNFIRKRVTGCPPMRNLYGIELLQ